MTNEQIQTRALELFNQYGHNRTRTALSILCDEVIDSGRCFPPKISLHYAVEKLAWEVYPIPEHLQTVVNTLKAVIGKTVTIVKSNSFGFVSQFVGKIEEVYVQNYAQYDNVMMIQFRAKRKKTSVVFMLLPLDQFAVYVGEVNTNTKTQHKVIKETSDVTVTSIGSAFDERHFTGAIASVNDKPIFVKHEKQFVY